MSGMPRGEKDQGLLLSGKRRSDRRASVLRSGPLAPYAAMVAIDAGRHELPTRKSRLILAESGGTSARSRFSARLPSEVVASGFRVPISPPHRPRRRHRVDTHLEPPTATTTAPRRSRPQRGRIPMFTRGLALSSTRSARFPPATVPVLSAYEGTRHVRVAVWSAGTA